MLKRFFLKRHKITKKHKERQTHKRARGKSVDNPLLQASLRSVQLTQKGNA